PIEPPESLGQGIITRFEAPGGEAAEFRMEVQDVGRHGPVQGQVTAKRGGGVVKNQENVFTQGGGGGDRERTRGHLQKLAGAMFLGSQAGRPWPLSGRPLELKMNQPNLTEMETLAKLVQ